VLNFANEDIAGTIRSEHLPPGSQVTDMFTGNQVGTVDDLHSFVAELPPHHGMSLLVEASDAGDRDLPDWPTHHRLTNKRAYVLEASRSSRHRTSSRSRARTAGRPP
jgi:hypothetical protein